MAGPAGKERGEKLSPESLADDPFGFAPWLKDMPAVPLHPLMAHPVAAMAAATAIGFGMAGQIAGLVMGAMQGAAERTRVEPDAPAPGETSAETASRPGRTGPPAKAKAVRTKPAPRKETKSRQVRATERPATETKKEQPAARKAAGGKVARTDDLKKIPGVGPKLEQMLNGMGLTRYADIAALSAADVKKIDGELGLDGRIARDDWVGEAGKLAKAKG
ncbi:MAG: NADH:ubiquinone oxidoreductase [Shinella sp.]|nr:NADH:ubiquinone oxidoreductase [Shinella sp.]